jgi:peptidoglycan hydrolase-like protein with peptidoglycan-binding domain
MRCIRRKIDRERVQMGSDMTRAQILVAAVSLVVMALAPLAMASAEEQVVCFKYSYGKNLVRAAQQKLQAWGYDPGPVDGYWGPATEAAVTVFQRHMSLQESTQLDEPTLLAMFGEPLPSGVTVVRNPMKLPADVFATQCGK